MNSSNSALFERVLLIEDDPSHALLVKRALKDFAKEVSHAENIAAGLKLISDSKPNLIITDLNLPDSSGAGASRLDHVNKLKEAANEAPIVVLTSSTSLDDAVEAMRLGAQDFVVKDFSSNFKAILGLSLSRLSATVLVEEQKRRLEREMAALRVAIENGDDGFAIVDSNGVLVYFNKAFRDFAGICGGKTESLKSVFGDAVKNSQQVVERLQSALVTMQAKAIFSTEITFQKNKEIAFEAHLSGIGAGQAGDTQAVVWIKDISEQKRREKFQREILSTTTHDLKGPLGAIVISSELLTDLIGRDSGKPSELVLRIGSSAQGAINLIDEFLSARRIQEGTFILRPTRQNLWDLSEECVEGQRTIAAARRIEFDISAKEGDLVADVDRMGFMRVLGNLISNALKFTPRDGRVSVSVLGQPDEVHVLVKDTGSGMEPSEVQKLFQRFSRLDRHTEVAGSGIGLFVVKSIVTAHGGKVEVSSRVGEGTTFDVALPRRPPVSERGELISLDFA